MNRIDKIISESINRFILREIEEGIDDMERTFSAAVTDPKTNKKVVVTAKSRVELNRKIAQLQGKTVQKRQYTKSKPLNNLSDVCERYVKGSPAKAKAIAKVINNEWNSRELGCIRTFNNNSYLLGVDDSENLHNRLRARNDNHDPFVPITNSYVTLLNYTEQIENWGNAGDYNSVHSRLCDMPQYLDDLADSLTKWYNQTGKEVKNNNPNINQTRTGNVITGYKRKNGAQAINGLMQIRRKPKNFAKIVDKLKNCAATIRYNFGDNFNDGKNEDVQIDMSSEPVSGIKTIRR
jgi:hypothetical protein